MTIFTAGEVAKPLLAILLTKAITLRLKGGSWFKTTIFSHSFSCNRGKDIKSKYIQQWHYYVLIICQKDREPEKHFQCLCPFLVLICVSLQFVRFCSFDWVSMSTCECSDRQPCRQSAVSVLGWIQPPCTMYIKDIQDRKPHGMWIQLRANKNPTLFAYSIWFKNPIISDSLHLQRTSLFTSLDMHKRSIGSPAAKQTFGTFEHWWI